jgi:dihydrodipicolinate reductase
VERHHNKKVMHLGTALLLADAMNEVLKQRISIKYDRSENVLPEAEKRLEYQQFAEAPL